MPSLRRLSSRCRTPSTRGAGALALVVLLGGVALAQSTSGVTTGRLDDGAVTEKVAPSSPAAASQGQARFEAALGLYTAGPANNTDGAAAAAAALEQLALDLPQDDIAPEALFEAAQLYDEQLARPEPARRLYEQLVSRYPSSRLLRRAESRLTQLRAGLRTGADALTRFQYIVRSTQESSAERMTQLQALLKERPDFALADRALYLLGAAQLRAGKSTTATATFAELARRYPLSEWTAYAHKAQADALTEKGLCGPARVHLQALAQQKGTIWASTAAEGLQLCDQVEHRRLWARLSAVYLTLLFLTLLVWTRRTLWPPPFEIRYYVPVAGFLVLTSLLVRNGMYLAPVSLLAGLGVVLNWLAAAAAARQAATHRPHHPLRRLIQILFGVAWRVLAVAAICYLVIHTQGLFDLLIETVRNGADE